MVYDFNSGATTVLAEILPGGFVIAGDGKSAWVHRADGRLVRVAIDTLQAFEVPGRHAWMARQDGANSQGSHRHLYGGGFASDDKVDLAGLSVPILTVDTLELDVQIPWEAPVDGQFPMTLHNPSSPFESVFRLDLEPIAPTFERTGVPGDLRRSLKIAHQDFHALVSESDPALPGEWVHAYMTGLSDAQQHPPTGAPPSVLSNATRPTCWLAAPPAAPLPAPVSFAGLATGMIGIDQADIQIPAGFPTSAR